MVFYRAVDDKLRVVYSNILKKMKFIQLRDKDALQLINSRDYELIEKSFNQHTQKVNLKQFYTERFSVKSSTYRMYNRAYYEEIVITNDVESRVARNYRERFLKSAEDIFIVFQMYCKEDYDEQFLTTKKDEISHDQFLELFVLSLRNDSFKIALLLYLNYLEPGDINSKILDIILATIRDSPKFHEAKLFLVHTHFNQLSIE
mmetsp:Transcript_12389/g.19299  ORF Transcript_12389/g.19299 Transcript_12389/m.19299 type:complete len:203 (+) Transcript_12389:1049-1657(+)